MGEMLEVWGVDSLQEMLDTSPLQHPSQVGDLFATLGLAKLGRGPYLGSAVGVV